MGMRKALDLIITSATGKQWLPDKNMLVSFLQKRPSFLPLKLEVSHLIEC